jgi:hypothetical protein
MSTQRLPARSARPATLEAVTRRPPRGRMPPASLGIRVKTSPALHTLLSKRLLLARAARRGQALWEQNPEERAKAISTIHAIVAGTDRAEEAQELARLYLIERELDTVLFWQPWSAGMDPASKAILRTAISAHRGVLLSACHLGPFYSSAHAFAPEIDDHYSVAGPWFFESPSHDYWGRRLARWRKGTVGRMVLSTGSFPVLQQLLEAGETVYLFYDLPGRRETRFLGKRAMLADGSARLAIEADALVLPLRSRREGDRVWVDLAPALDPRELSGVQGLHDALAATHERWIVENPSAMADPNSFGWEQGATARAWIRP